MQPQRNLDLLLREALNGREAAWPSVSAGLPDANSTLDRIRYHGIALLLVERRECLVDWPAALLQGIAEEARLQAIWESSHKSSLERVLKEFAARNIDVVVNKGTAQAYSVFPDPATRRRGDTDLIVRLEDRASARAIFSETGFVRRQASPTQEDWVHDTGMGFTHAVDLHWQANSSRVMRQVFSPDEAIERGVGLPRLAPVAKAVDPVLLFLSDVLNQTMHAISGIVHDGEWVKGGDRLVWTYGLHLQASGFSPVQWQELAEEAIARGLPQLSLKALHRAKNAFGTQVPSAIQLQLQEAGMQGTMDRYALSLSNPERALLELRHAYGLGDAAQLLVSHAIAPEKSLRDKYPNMGRLPLLFLHLRRWNGGIQVLVRALARRIGRVLSGQHGT